MLIILKTDGLVLYKSDLRISTAGTHIGTISIQYLET